MEAVKEAVSLSTLPPELLLRVLRSAGAPAVAASACTCKRLRAAQAELAPVAAFASALVQIPACAPVEATAATVAAAREATRSATTRMVNGVDFALVLVSHAAGAAPGVTLPAAVEAARAALPRAVVVLGVTGATVAGPRARDGAVVEADSAVCVLLGCVPGCVATVTRGPHPALRGTVAPADPRVAAWLRAPPAHTHTLAWCALFLAPTQGEELPFVAAPPAARAWPAAALVGGFVSAPRRGNLGFIATAGPGEAADGRHRAAALCVFAPAAAAPPPVRAAAAATRGLEPWGSVWTVDDVGVASDDDEQHGDEQPERARLRELRLHSAARVEPAPPDTVPPGAGGVGEEALQLNRLRVDDIYLCVWPGAPAGADAAVAAAEAEARARAPGWAVNGMAMANSVQFMGRAAHVLGADAAAALAARRLRCQLRRCAAAPARADAADAAARVAAAVGFAAAPRAVLAAACSARGAHLFGRAGVEAAALAAAFPGAYASVTVNGELGPPPEGGGAELQAFTTTMAALGA